MKEKTLADFKNDFAVEKGFTKWLYLVINTPDKGMIPVYLEKAAENYANHVKAIALQGFKDEVITQINHAKDNFPSHSFDHEFTRGITKGFQMASAIVNTKPTTPK